MRDSIKQLIDEYQIRKTYKQKTEFINYLKNVASNNDYDIKIDTNKNNRNLIIGNVDKAKIIFSAHYDTQPNSIIPIYTFVSNIMMYLLSQIFSMWPIFAYMFIIFNITPLINNTLLTIFFIVFFNLIIPLVFIYQISFGYQNKHTLNDNTSGVASLICIMEDLKFSDREKVAFVFFDQEEKGLIGSSHFKMKYNNSIINTPLINFDCVGDGVEYLFVAKKAFREDRVYSILKDISSLSNKKINFKKATTVPYMSDQILFKNSLGVVSVKKIFGLGYYLNRIHTRKDTMFQYDNIQSLSQLSIELISKL